MEEKYHIALQGLLWEARYRVNRPPEEGNSYFLPAMDGFDPDFAEAAHRYHIRQGTVLDIGTGTGMQAIHLARLGFPVTGIDIAATAITQAKKNAAKANIGIEFHVANILSNHLSGRYDVIMDRGCVTVLPDVFKPLYARNVAALLPEKGYFFLKADLQIGHKAIAENFSPWFILRYVKKTIYQGQSAAEQPIKALFGVLQKKAPGTWRMRRCCTDSTPPIQPDDVSW